MPITNTMSIPNVCELFPLKKLKTNKLFELKFKKSY